MKISSRRGVSASITDCTRAIRGAGTVEATAGEGGRVVGWARSVETAKQAKTTRRARPQQTRIFMLAPVAGTQESQAARPTGDDDNRGWNRIQRTWGHTRTYGGRRRRT